MSATFIANSLYLLVFTSHYRLFVAGTGKETTPVCTHRGALFFCDGNLTYDPNECYSNVEAYGRGGEPIVIIRIADLSSVFLSAKQAQNYLDKLLRPQYFRTSARTERRWFEDAVYTLGEGGLFELAAGFWGRVSALEARYNGTIMSVPLDWVVSK